MARDDSKQQWHHKSRELRKRSSQYWNKITCQENQREAWEMLQKNRSGDQEEEGTTDLPSLRPSPRHVLSDRPFWEGGLCQIRARQWKMAGGLFPWLKGPEMKST